jgi:hypothetical protein
LSAVALASGFSRGPNNLSVSFIGVFSGRWSGWRYRRMTSRVGRGRSELIPYPERLERVLRDEPTVLADDHDRGDGRSFLAVAFHRRLHFNPRVLTHRPLAVPATRAASSAASFQSRDDLVLVVRGNSLVVIHGIPR